MQVEGGAYVDRQFPAAQSVVARVRRRRKGIDVNAPACLDERLFYLNWEGSTRALSKAGILEL